MPGTVEDRTHESPARAVFAEPPEEEGVLPIGPYHMSCRETVGRPWFVPAEAPTAWTCKSDENFDARSKDYTLPDYLSMVDTLPYRNENLIRCEATKSNTSNEV